MSTVIHVDMDAFFAAIEIHDRPELRGRPVVVGGPPGSRGVVSTASYEARAFGVRSAMPSREAYRLCPQAVFLPGRYGRYAEVSEQIMGILREEAGEVEPLSIDEAYMAPRAGQDPVAVARRIKSRIAAETGLTASVGVAPNKLLAKLASDIEKPDGFVVIGPEQLPVILPPLPVRALPGIGPKTAGVLARLGIHSVGQLQAADRGLLRLEFGRRADELLDLAFGRDHRPIVTGHESKSISTETTFEEDIGDWRWLGERLGEYADELAARLAAHGGMRARTITVKLRFADFHTVSRSRTLPAPVRDARDIARAAEALLRQIERLDRVRLLGLGVSGLTDHPEPVQLSFPFLDGGERERRSEAT
jgi:DNA polymerase-4